MANTWRRRRQTPSVARSPKVEQIPTDSIVKFASIFDSLSPPAAEPKPADQGTASQAHARSRFPFLPRRRRSAGNIEQYFP
jgi:hypothetical protein